MHWTLSFSVALRHFRFSSFGMVAFRVGCGVVGSSKLTFSAKPTVRSFMFLHLSPYNSEPN